ncbi:MAG: hypothetical protein M3271_00185 [Actinomycetota bacterium]|nr:hypothetical protein [Actinomycetota bacterium]
MSRRDAPKVRYVWSAAAIVAAAGAAILIARAGAPGERLAERPPEAELYEMLMAADLSSLAEEEGLTFIGGSGMLPPHEAASERHWIVYAGFGGRPGRHRIAYQIAVDTPIPTRCESDFAGWDCSSAIGDVAVKGQAICLRPGCVVTREDAVALRRMGLEHLRTILESS